MKKMRTVKVKAGQEKLRERIKDALAQKGARAHISAPCLPDPRPQEREDRDRRSLTETPAPRAGGGQP